MTEYWCNVSERYDAYACVP